MNPPRLSSSDCSPSERKQKSTTALRKQGKKKKKRAATVHLLGVHRISAVLHFWYPFSAHMMHHETLIGGREGVRWPLMTASRALGGFQEHLRPRGWARDVTTQCTLTRRGRTPTLYALSVPPPPQNLLRISSAIDEHTRSIKVGGFQQENMAAEKRNKAHSISAAEELVSGGKHYATGAFLQACVPHEWVQSFPSSWLRRRRKQQA